jgi:hypothetical protein
MMLPDYWLPRPPSKLDNETRSAFNALLAKTRSERSNTLIDYRLAAPKWQFLCHLADEHGIVMHGTGTPNIEIFEPRQSNDLNEFGNRKAVYGAGDGLWAMFFAIVDRQRVMSVTNACIRLADAEGNLSEPRYIFSISRTALPERPWRSGMVYLLPAEGFVAQGPLPFGEFEVRIPQLANFSEVRPIGRLEVAPEDFPFLEQIRGHDDARLAEYAQALQTGGAWPEEGEG